MNGALFRPDRLPVKDRGGGIVTIPLAPAARGARAMLTGITTIAPGSAVPLHTHNCEDSVVVLSGQGVAPIDAADHPVAPRDTSCIPARLPPCFRKQAREEPTTNCWAHSSTDATRPSSATRGATRTAAER